MNKTKQNNFLREAHTNLGRMVWSGHTQGEGLGSTHKGLGNTRAGKHQGLGNTRGWVHQGLGSKHRDKALIFLTTLFR